MPRPNTTYRVLNSSNTVLHSGLGFYEALERLRANGSATKITDASGKTVFVRNSSPNVYQVYQFNEYYGTKSPKGSAKDGTGMLGWINDYRYSKAVCGDGMLSNSYTKVFFRNPAVTLDGVYKWQEVNSGGYYSVRTLSTASTNIRFNKAKFTVNLAQASVNQPDGINNAYLFVGVNSGKASCEFGFQRHERNWHVLYNVAGTKFVDLGSLDLGLSNTNVTAEIEKINGGLKMNLIGAKVGSQSSWTYSNPEFNDSKPFEFYHSISLCPVESNNKVVSNLNNGGYFKNASFKNCQIARKGQGYEPWLYNSSFNQFAVAFNDEFIEVNPSTETASISYKGRDNNDNLIF